MENNIGNKCIGNKEKVGSLKEGVGYEELSGDSETKGEGAWISPSLSQTTASNFRH